MGRRPSLCGWDPPGTYRRRARAPSLGSMPPFRLPAAAAAVIVLLAGCGSGGDTQRTSSSGTGKPAAPAAARPAAEQAVADTLERYAAAVRAGDARMICAELLDPPVLATVKQAGGDCERDLLAERIAEGGPGYRLDVRSIEIAGDRATARTEATERDGKRAVVQPLVRAGGGWRLSR